MASRLQSNVDTLPEDTIVGFSAVLLLLDDFSEHGLTK